MPVLNSAMRLFTGCVAALAVALLMTTGSAIAETALQAHKAEYKVNIAVIGTGVLKTRLEPADDGWTASHVVRPTGIAKVFYGGKITDTSEFEVAGSGLRTTRFLTSDLVTKDKIQADVDFDWAAGEIRGELNGSDYVAELDRPMFDRVSIQYELMNDLLNGRERDAYVLFEFDERKDVQVRRIGEREVKVPAGKFTAIGLQHQAVGSKRITTLWCVEELGYLPVMIEQHRRGKLKMRASLRRYEPIGS